SLACERAHQPVLARQHFESFAGAQSQAAAASPGDRQTAGDHAGKGTGADSHETLSKSGKNQGGVRRGPGQETARQAGDRARPGGGIRGARCHAEKITKSCKSHWKNGPWRPSKAKLWCCYCGRGKSTKACSRSIRSCSK